MKINEYPIEASHLNRAYLNEFCRRVSKTWGYEKYYRPKYQRHIAWLSCFDNLGLYFGSLGIEFGYIDESIHTGPYGHFALQRVNIKDFENEDANKSKPRHFLDLKHHPAIYQRVERLRRRCEFINIDIKYYHESD